MQNISRHFRAVRGAMAGTVTWCLSSAAAFALEPVNWQVGYQTASTPIAERAQAFGNGLLMVMTLITLFVLTLLVLVIVRFNAKANPVPSKTSHNTMIEVVWTVIPVLILVGVAVPSFSLLFAANDPARAIPGYDATKEKPLTIKVIGHQWSWSYEYPDNGGIAVDSGPVRDPDKDFAPGGKPRLLEADYAMVVPVGQVIRLHVATTDVIHSFTVPAFSLKMDAVPGRLNEIWFRADKEGIYYGQCAQLCGQDHAFMPINVRVVSKEKYAQWAAAAKTNLDGAYKTLGAIDTTAPTTFAAR
ncbi:MAG: cytochrome c oxidase subunit II [Bauldia sp.]